MDDEDFMKAARNEYADRMRSESWQSEPMLRHPSRNAVVEVYAGDRFFPEATPSRPAVDCPICGEAFLRWSDNGFTGSFCRSAGCNSVYIDWPPRWKDPRGFWERYWFPMLISLGPCAVILLMHYFGG